MISYVNSSVKIGSDSNSSSKTSAALSVTSGNLIVFAIKYFGSVGTEVITGISDTVGTTYSVVQGISGNEIWYGFANGTNGTNILTVSFSANVADNGTIVSQYSGVNSYDTTSTTISPSATNVTSQSSSITTTVNNELVVEVIGIRVQTATYTATTGYSLRQSTTDNNNQSTFGLFDNLVASPGSQTVGVTSISPSSQDVRISLATFIPNISKLTGISTIQGLSSITF